MNNTTTSKFDSGERSNVNGLPTIPDIARFLESLLQEDPNLSYSRAELRAFVIDEFRIPSSVSEAVDKSNTPLLDTRLNYILADGVQGEREDHIEGSPIVGEPWAKRIGTGTYQHISGPGKAIPSVKRAPKAPKPEPSLLDEAMAFMRRAKNLDFSMEQAKDMWKERFPVDILNQSASAVFQ